MKPLALSVAVNALLLKRYRRSADAERNERRQA